MGGHMTRNASDDSLGGPVPSTAHRCHLEPRRRPVGEASPTSPLLFHPTARGSQIVVDPVQRSAKRTSSFCNGITFSNRPVAPHEQVRLQITRKQSCWSGALRLGFTSRDPSRLDPDSLPRYACPDLVAQTGFWAKALPEEFANEGNVLAFWVDRKGRVFYRVNRTGPVLFFSGVRSGGPLWALIDVYGLTREVQLLDSAAPDSLRPRGANESRLFVSLGDLSLRRDHPGPAHSHTLPPPTCPAPQSSQQSLLLPPSLDGAAWLLPPRGAPVRALDQRSSSNPGSPSSAPPAAAADLVLDGGPAGLRSSAGGTAPSSPAGLPKSPTLPSGRAARRDECSVCYDNAVDTVIYACGHMCLCSACGLRLKAAPAARCPICRRRVRDIIRTYRST